VDSKPNKPHTACVDGCVYTKEGSPSTDLYCMVNNNMDAAVFQCEDSPSDFPTTPNDWVRPVLLESGYAAHLISGLGPVHLKTGVSPKQIADAGTGGINPLLVGEKSLNPVVVGGKKAKTLLTGLQPLTIEPWQVLAKESRKKREVIPMQPETTLCGNGVKVVLHQTKKQPTIIHDLKRKPTVVYMMKQMSY